MNSILTPNSTKTWVMEHGARPQGRTHEVTDLRLLARAMDSQFSIGGFKFGWDGILGLIPGIGDVATSLASFYIIIRAAALGATPAVLARMGLNVLIDNTLDAIPILGQIFDFLWKSNNRNLALLEAHLANPRATRRASALVVGLILLGTIAAVITLLAVSAMALIWVVEALRTGTWG